MNQKGTKIKILNKNRNLKNIKKRASKAMSNSENIENNKYESIIKKDDDDKYYEKDNESINSNNESNSENTLESINDDNIDDEINEMNDIEEEILTIMEQIKEFQKQKNDLT